MTAPYDGYMGRRTLEPGQFVQAGQTISYLVRSKDKWITANYKETQIVNIYIGQPVRIKVDALPGKVFEGKLQLYQKQPAQNIRLFLQIILPATL